MENNNLRAALTYLKKYHFSVIPIPKGKKYPVIKWEEYQKRLPTEQEVVDWWTKRPDSNIAIVTGIISGIYAIDLDDSEAEKTFNELVPDTLIMPTVSTPRGGKHHYFKCIDSELRNASFLLGKKMDFRGNGGIVVVPPSVNGTGKPYTYVDKLSIKDVAMPLLPDNIISIISSSKYNTSTSTINIGRNLQPSTNVYKCLQEGCRDEDMFHVANCLIRGKTHIGDVVELLEIYAKNCNPPYPEKDISVKIQSALDRVARRERNLAKEVEEWVCLQDGYFFSTDVVNSLQLSTREEKKNLWIILRRLCEESIIEKHGTKSGQYRLLNTEINRIDFLNASDENVLLLWPFEIEKYALLYPGNICIVAGTSNAGKTALLLNFVNMNMDKFKIRYQSSEMGESELKRRLSFFSTPLQEFKKVEWIDRAKDWWDLVEPEAINIIDYMEIHEEHYKISGWIKKIFDKLTTGIAILALQKPAGRQLGVGGSSTLDKSRLYLSVDFDKITMVKAKNWATNINPNGLSISYELHQGIHFTSDSTWKKEG